MQKKVTKGNRSIVSTVRSRDSRNAKHSPLGEGLTRSPSAFSFGPVVKEAVRSSTSAVAAATTAAATDGVGELVRRSGPVTTPSSKVTRPIVAERCWGADGGSGGATSSASSRPLSGIVSRGPEF